MTLMDRISNLLQRRFGPITEPQMQMQFMSLKPSITPVSKPLTGRTPLPSVSDGVQFPGSRQPVGTLQGFENQVSLDARTKVRYRFDIGVNQ